MYELLLYGLEIKEKFYGEDSMFLAEDLVILGELYDEDENTEKAIEYYEKHI